MNVRNLINLNNIQNNNQQDDAANEGMNIRLNINIGRLFEGPGAGANGAERAMFWVFKVIQLLLMWQLLSFVIHNISPEHICIMAVIVMSYWVIEHHQRRRRDRPQQEEGRQAEEEEGRQAEERQQG
jgi:hypothetical protein